ncbi:ArsR/SmtB family transcription factor [Allobaculum stercoricanis]|uniref:ArsR/SmtB family transcription factor n=1 Tax=Allobaculum stercoricanis TaxID=174709 RepID=UPI00036E288F|nr:metalloregulator ArsR/SmtB family transcription factor [Allobaculum stercoricanis]
MNPNEKASSNTTSYAYEIWDQQAYNLAKSHTPEVETIDQLANFYKIMADPTRLKILIALESGELCVTDIALLVNMSRSAVSHQLRSLKSAKLVRSRKDGKGVFYTLDDEHIHSIINVALTHIKE